MRLGSLCSGVGLLDLAVESLFGAETAWQAENDKDASKVLARRWPGVPNLGDLKAVDWSSVEPVDVLCAGYPCQPFSSAGRRNGTDDPRHLWPDVARAIGALRPRLVFLENVAAHLSLGFTAVLGDFAAMGFDAEWGLVRASEVGAPHRRERLFILAWPAADAARSPRREVARGAHGYEADDEGRPEDTGVLLGGRGEAARTGVALLPTPRATRGGSHTETAYLLPTPAARDWKGQDAPGRAGGANLPSTLLPTPAAADGSGGKRAKNIVDGKRPSGAKASISLRTSLDALLPTPTHRITTGEWQGGQGSPDLKWVVNHAQWGDFAVAIDRWEAVLGREAPAPLEGKRLSARFVEWMMGAPDGWVTDTPGVSHSAALRCLGNGCMTAQAVMAYRLLLDRIEVAA